MTVTIWHHVLESEGILYGGINLALIIEDVRHVAKLARLALTEEEMVRLLGHLNALMEHFTKLQELDTTQIEPTSHSIPILNVFREDQTRCSLLPESFLRNAPEAEDNLFIVPRIVEDEG
jgi:aspartyl-tRNA(Asn)/glutamyl-tRNA(Gln) amidotransferase subunit C